MNVSPVSPYLCVWTVIALRTALDAAAARAAIAARGARAVLLPALRLAPVQDRVRVREDLSAAMSADALVFTSPAAVRFAARLTALAARGSQCVIAVGGGTAQALRRHGITAVHPQAGAMHSEGVLALPALSPPPPRVGLVTAPGGRDLIGPTLQARGAQVMVATVYRRVEPRLRAPQIAALIASAPPRAVLLTSAEALRNALRLLPEAARARLLDAVAVTSSARMTQIARDAGFRATVEACAPDMENLLDALAAHAKAASIR
jgi:uroporphyrinogen-III synthase